MIRRFLLNYLPRHRNRWNQLLHIVGIPLTFVAPIVCIVEGQPWYWAVICFIAGYALQFAGHAVEGNDAGEVAFVKKLCGLPFTEYGPDSNSSSDSDSSADSCGG